MRPNESNPDETVVEVFAELDPATLATQTVDVAFTRLDRVSQLVASRPLQRHTTNLDALWKDVHALATFARSGELPRGWDGHCFSWHDALFDLKMLIAELLELLFVGPFMTLSEADGQEASWWREPRSDDTERRPVAALLRASRFRVLARERRERRTGFQPFHGKSGSPW